MSRVCGRWRCRMCDLPRSDGSVWQPNTWPTAHDQKCCNGFQLVWAVPSDELRLDLCEPHLGVWWPKGREFQMNSCDTSCQCCFCLLFRFHVGVTNVGRLTTKDIYNSATMYRNRSAIQRKMMERQLRLNNSWLLTHMLAIYIYTAITSNEYSMKSLATCYSVLFEHCPSQQDRKHYPPTMPR